MRTLLAGAAPAAHLHAAWKRGIAASDRPPGSAGLEDKQVSLKYASYFPGKSRIQKSLIKKAKAQLPQFLFKKKKTPPNFIFL